MKKNTFLKSKSIQNFEESTIKPATSIFILAVLLIFTIGGSWYAIQTPTTEETEIETHITTTYYDLSGTWTNQDSKQSWTFTKNNLHIDGKPTDYTYTSTKNLLELTAQTPKGLQSTTYLITLEDNTLTLTYEDTTIILKK